MIKKIFKGIKSFFIPKHTFIIDLNKTIKMEKRTRNAMSHAQRSGVEIRQGYLNKNKVIFTAIKDNELVEHTFKKGHRRATIFEHAKNSTWEIVDYNTGGFDNVIARGQIESSKISSLKKMLERRYMNKK